MTNGLTIVKIAGIGVGVYFSGKLIFKLANRQ